MELELRPNTKKLIIWSMMKTLGGVIVILALLWTFSYFAGYGVKQLFEDIGIQVDNSSLLKSFGLGISISMLVIVAVHLLGLSSNKIVVSDNGMRVDNRDILFDNVARVNFDNSQLHNKLMNTGTINFELTGTNAEKVEIVFVDEPKTMTEKVQNFLNTYRMRRYQNYADQKRVQSIIAEY